MRYLIIAVALAAACTKTWPSSLRDEFIAGCTREGGDTPTCTCMADHLEPRLTTDDLIVVSAAIKLEGAVPMTPAGTAVAEARRYCGIDKKVGG